MIRATSSKALHRLGPNIRKHQAKMEHAIHEGVIETCKFILDESGKHVPKDTGSLAKSKRLTITGFGFATQGRVGYGIPGEHYNEVWSLRSGVLVDRYPYDYALYVHEIPPSSGGVWGTGNTHPIGSYQFLVGTMNENWQTMSNIFVTTVQIHVGSYQRVLPEGAIGRVHKWGS